MTTPADHEENPISHNVEASSTTAGLPVSPSMGPAIDAALVPVERSVVDRRVVTLSLGCIALGAVAAVIAQVLIHLIAFITNLAFYQRISIEDVSPAAANLGWWVVVVPVIGGVIVGLMARYGSKAIRGHGIPEAMEQVLTNQSRIPRRLTFLKPLSAAVAIGTGGPFGAEGPIIATGGALGSAIGQFVRTTIAERKTLLAAGAAAGMAATFGAPVSAVLLAIELLLFEFRPASLIPVALAASTAAAVRVVFEGFHAVFPMPELSQISGSAMAGYILIGCVIGLLSVVVTKVVYWVEDLFEHLPVHWMWWPAIGGLAVGIVGYFAPRTLGVGYDNITHTISGDFTVGFLLWLVAMKFVSWTLALGSGTSGGTLAPLFTIGGGCGFVMGFAMNWIAPQMAVDPRIAALVGMAAIFAGASRALLASVVFAFETTLQPLGLLPLLGGCSAAYLVSSLVMRTSIMTEKIARRGVRVPQEYAPDTLEQITVSEVASSPVISLEARERLGVVRQWIQSQESQWSHQGFPVVDQGKVVGVLTRRVLLDRQYSDDQPLQSLLDRPPIVVFADCTLRDAADQMMRHDIGRLPVIDRQTAKMVGFVTRSDLLKGYRRAQSRRG